MVVVGMSVGDNIANKNDWANANLTSITKAFDVVSTSGLDGAITMAYGEMATAGAIGNTTLTTGTAVETVEFLLVLNPAETDVEVLTASSVSSTSEVSVPSLSDAAGTDLLTAVSVETTSEISTPSINGTIALLADDVETAAELSSPVVLEPRTVGSGAGGVAITSTRQKQSNIFLDIVNRE
jgi:hypothetical protein